MSRADSRRVPVDQRDAVVKALYADADRLDWAHLPINKRTAQYDKWVTDPEIGGVLTNYMTAETARSWIKDGPMKEYLRASQGAGRYAAFGSSPSVTSEQIAKHALGTDAAVVEGSIGVKPFHCVGILDQTQTYIAWGEAKNFRYLVWACLTYLADQPNGTATIVVTETMADPTTAAEKARHTAIAERCALGLKYHRAATPKRTTRDEAVS